MEQDKLNEYIKRAHKTARNRGFHGNDTKMPMEHWLMLVITEVAGMVEADCKGKHAQVAMFKRESVTPQPKNNREKHWRFCFETFIKDTVEDEMADICIRLFDLAGMKRWKIEIRHSENDDKFVFNYLRLRPFTESAWKLCEDLTGWSFRNLHVANALHFIECWAKYLDIDLEWHIDQKMEYNEQRAVLARKKILSDHIKKRLSP